LKSIFGTKKTIKERKSEARLSGGDTHAHTTQSRNREAVKRWKDSEHTEI